MVLDHDSAIMKVWYRIMTVCVRWYRIMTVRVCNTLFPPACKYNWTGQELWRTHKYEYMM
jgi:hypothetical protein